MHWGICGSLEKTAEMKAAGWDFVEENVQGFLQAQTSDREWPGWERLQAAALPATSANCLVPGGLKITGPAVDFDALRRYMAVVVARAARTGTRVLVFGSGGARQVPEGFDRVEAVEQITTFAKMSAELAVPYGVTIVLEPLHRAECNIINTVAEGMEYVRRVNHPRFQCLVDSYHFWLENEPLENLQAAMPHIRHVHIADKDGRVAPGESGTSDYRPFFAVLKQGGYDGCIAVECKAFDIPTVGPKVLAFLKKQWAEAK